MEKDIDVEESEKSFAEEFENANLVDNWLKQVKELHNSGNDSQIADYIRLNLAGYKSYAFSLAQRALLFGISPKAFGFCSGITHILDGGFYGIANKGYDHMRMKLETSIDSDHDRKACGDKTANRFHEGRFLWSFRPINDTSNWDYYLVNQGNGWGETYLKLALKTDKYLDRRAYGAPYPSNEKRFKWRVTVENPYVNYFVIYSLQIGEYFCRMPLKLSSVVEYGDRDVWGDGNLMGYPGRTKDDRFQWSIEEP